MTCVHIYELYSKLVLSPPVCKGLTSVKVRLFVWIFVWLKLNWRSDKNPRGMVKMQTPWNTDKRQKYFYHFENEKALTASK